MNSEDTRDVSEVVTVLLVSPFDEDHLNLRSITRHSNLQPHSARSQAEALEFLQENLTPVVISECDLPDGTWRDLLSEFARMQCAPLLVVTSRFADEHLWSEVLNLGAYNVLAKPLSTKEVFHVVGLAAQSWKRSWMLPRQFARTA
jgi:DNA-binding NtrC family response regulator